MKTTDSPARRFGRAITYLRRARKLMFGLISDDDRDSPLALGLAERFDDLQADSRGYALYLLSLRVNSRGEVEEVDIESKKESRPGRPWRGKG